MTIPRRHLNRQASTVVQLVEIKMVIAARGHQFQMISQGEAVFDFDLCQTIATLSGQLPDKLLAM